MESPNRFCVTLKILVELRQPLTRSVNRVVCDNTVLEQTRQNFVFCFRFPAHLYVRNMRERERERERESNLQSCQCTAVEVDFLNYFTAYFFAQISIIILKSNLAKGSTSAAIIKGN